MTDESPDIGDLRQELKSLKKKLKAADAEEAAMRTEIRDELIRVQSVEEYLTELGHPAGMREAIEDTLGAAPPTRDTVAAALEKLGYENVGVEKEVVVAPDSVQSHPELESVVRLSGSVNAVSDSGRPLDLTQRINQTKNQDELNKLMAEQGLSADYSGEQ